MIKYNLECKCGKKFESWFLSSAEYDDLRKKKINQLYLLQFYFCKKICNGS